MTDRPRVPRWLGYLVLAEAATFAVASYLHHDGRIALGFTTVTGEHFPGAATPEAIIGAVLAVAGVIIVARPGRARGVAIGATGFAILGVIVGMMVLIGGSRRNIAADLAYHTTILVALIASAALLTVERPDRRAWHTGDALPQPSEPDPAPHG